ncbi:hypothetical protein CAPTEDRAFT_76451, partial [Capitella teleta]
VENGDYEFVQEILQSGLDPNCRGDPVREPLLHIAARDNRVGIVFLLVLFGSDCNVTNGVGETSLHIAARFGFVDLVHALIEGGSEREHRNREGKTALDIAQEEGHDAVVEILERRIS